MCCVASGRGQDRETAPVRYGTVRVYVYRTEDTSGKMFPATYCIIFGMGCVESAPQRDDVSGHTPVTVTRHGDGGGTLGILVEPASPPRGSGGGRRGGYSAPHHQDAAHGDRRPRRMYCVYIVCCCVLA